MDSATSALGDTFTRQQAVAAGLADGALYGLRDRGEIFEIGRGVYRRIEAPPSPHLDVLAACVLAPRAVVCLLSALVLHDLTDEVPSRVHLAIPRGINTPRFSYPAIQVSRFDPATFSLGAEFFPISPRESVPAYDPARTIVDLLRLRGRYGNFVAYAALHLYLSRVPDGAARLSRYAARLRVDKVVRQALEVILSK